MNHGSNELHGMAIATKLEQDDIAVVQNKSHKNR
jgi:hypothetical protein